MTMIDESFLGSALEDLAGAFTVPANGAATIKALARTVEVAPSVTPGDGMDDDRVESTSADCSDVRPPARRLPNAGTKRRTRWIASAAAVVVAAAAGVGVVEHRGSNAGFTASRSHGTQAGSTTAQKPGRTGSQGAATMQAIAGSPNGGGSAHRGGSPNQGFIQATGNAADSNSAMATMNGADSVSPSAPGTGPSSVSAPPLPTGSVGTNPAIEKTGSVVLTVRPGTFSTVVDRLTTLATGTGGFVASTQTAQGSGTPDGTVSLEIPVGDFESVLTEVRALGTVDSISTKATDVTGQVVDLQARIQALQQSLSQYEKIMSQASSIGEILSVQSQVDAIQSQIEQLQGQQNLLNAVTAYSMLAVSVSEHRPPSHAPAVPGAPSGIGHAWHDAVDGFTTAFDGLVAVAGPLLFALLCLVAVAVAARMTWRAVRRWRL